MIKKQEGMPMLKQLFTPIFKRAEKEQLPKSGDTLTYNGKDYTILNEEPNGTLKLIYFNHSDHSIFYYKNKSMKYETEKR